MRWFFMVLLIFGCVSNQKTEKEELTRRIQQEMEEADRLYQQGDYEGALRLREGLLKRHPTHPLVHNQYFYLWLGDCYFVMRRYIKAWDAYSEAAKLAFEGLKEAREKILSARDVQEARRWRKLADERLRPGLSAAHRRLAQVLMMKRKWDAALRHIELALDIYPDDLRAMYLRARILEKAGRDARGAWRGFLEAVRRAPKIDLLSYDIGQKEISEAEAKLGGSSR